MNLLFRLIWTMLRAMFGAAHAPLTEPRQMTFSVWITDQDMFMHMTNSRYLSFADLGRVDLSMRTGLRRAWNRQNWRAEICAQTMTVNRMLKAPKSFILETQILGWTDEYLAVGQTFLRNGKTHASVNTLLSIQDKSGELVQPAALIALVDPGIERPALPKLFADLVAKTNESAAAD